MRPTASDAPADAQTTEALVRTLGCLPVGVMLVDRSGTILWQNQALLRSLGLDPDVPSPAMGRRLSDMPNLQAMEAVVGRVLAGREVRAALTEFTSLGGRTVSLSLDAGPLGTGPPPPEGEPAFWMMFRDLAQGAPLAGRLQKAQQMEFVGVAVTGVIHDLNNILTALGGTVELMRSGEVTGTALVGSLDGMLRRSRDITRQLLRAARASGTGLEPIDLRTPVRQSYDLFRHGFDERVRVFCDLPTHQVPVQGDRAGLLQVLFNLAVNARDAMDGAGELHIELDIHDDPALCAELGWSGPGTARVRVWDTGPGIPNEAIEKVFEPFFSTKSVDENTGMGLSVVRRLVLDHGGVVRVLQKPGRGATFEIQLPLHSEAVTDDEPTRAITLPAFLTERSPVLDGVRVLVADDEPALRLMLDDALRRLGATVESVANGPDAVALLHERAERGDPFDVALIDMQLPGLPGSDVIDLARAEDPGLRLIAMSGLEPRGPTSARLTACGAAFLPKPFRLGEVIDALLGR